MTNVNSIATLPTGSQYYIPSIGQRWLARFIDNTPMAIVMNIAVWRGSLPALVALAILQPIYEIALIKKYGQTVGKMVMNIKVVRFDDAAELGWDQSFMRWFVWQTPLWIYLLIGAIVFGVGDSLLVSLVILVVIGAFMYVVELIFVGVIVITALKDPNRRGWHDKIARTIVIRIPATEPPVVGQPHEASLPQQAPIANRDAAGATFPAERDPAGSKPVSGTTPVSERPAASPTPVGKTSRQVQIAIPSIDRLLVVVGAAAMVLSGLLSWLTVAPDAFPNYAGVGDGGDGTGLVVFLVGIALLVRAPHIDTQIGVTLGVFVASLVTAITLSGEGLGAGVWVAIVGSLLALAGIVVGATDATRRKARRVEHQAMGWMGAVLALLASFWMDWPASTVTRSAGSDFTSGLDGDVATGYPVLILSGVVLVLLIYRSQVGAPGGANAAMHIRVAGIAVAAITAADIAGSLMSASWTGSGPVLALVGALMVAGSVVPATGAIDGDTAESEAA